MSDLFGNHIVGFPTRWLKCLITLSYMTTQNMYSYIYHLQKEQVAYNKHDLRRAPFAFLTLCFSFYLPSPYFSDEVV